MFLNNIIKPINRTPKSSIYWEKWIKVVSGTVNQELHRTHRLQNTVVTNGDTQKVRILLPYNGKQGNKLSKMKRLLNKSLPTEIKTIVTYQSERLVTKFKVKGKTKFYPHNNLVFYSKCPDDTCIEDYVC